MRFHKTLDNKFAHIQDKTTQVRKPAVSATLRAFLQNESLRIDHLIEKKKMCNQMLKSIQQKNLSYRENLRNKIEEQQVKHKKNRDKFLEKRVKGEKYKIEEVEKKRTALFEKLKQKRKSNEQTFRKTKSATIDFWKSKDYSTLKSYQQQTSVAPLFEDAVSRKKTIQRRNDMYGEQIKDQLLARHALVTERMENIWLKKKKILDEHNQIVERDYDRHQDILEKRENKFVNNICFQRNRSELLLRKNEKEWQKKLKGKLIDYHDNIDKKKQNFMQRTMKRAQTMKSCRCHNRGSSSQALTKSINLNEQQLQIKTNTGYSDRKNWSTKQTHQNFMIQSQANLSGVINNKSIIRQKQDLRDQKKLMTEKEIADAVRTREEIKNQSNLMVRQARVLA